MKQAHTPTTTKVHYKLYKAGKFWLVGTLATVSLVAGLAVTNSARADTTGDKDSATSAVSSSSSSTPANSATLSSSKQDSQSNTASQSTSPNSVPTNTPAKHTAVSTATSTATSTTTPSDPQKKVTTPSVPTASKPKPTPVSAAAVTAASGYSATRAVKSLLTPKRSFKHVSTKLSVAAVPEVTTPTPGTGTDINGNLITATPMSKIPIPGNFYVNVKAKFIPYDSKALVGLVPYNSENYTTTDGQLDTPDLYGFYVVLPTSITANLSDLKTAADSYVKSLQANTYLDTTTNKQVPYVDIKGLTVHQLANTSEATGNRQVYYFQPNDGAKFTKVNPVKGYSSQVHMYALVSTASSKDATKYSTITLNDPDQNPLPVNDVLFMGTGNLTTSPSGDYSNLTPEKLYASQWPDQHVVGLTHYNGGTTLTYTNITVTDNYAVLTNPELNNSSGFAKYPKTVIEGATPGTEYNPATVLTTDGHTLSLTLTSFGLSPKVWWKPSLYYAGTSTKMPANKQGDQGLVNKGAVPTTAVVEPTSLEIQNADSTAVPGINYLFVVERIQTKLNPTNLTLISGQSWDPADTLTGLSPDGSTLNADAAAQELTPTLGHLTYTFTDANKKTVDEESLKKTGTYSINYSYSDAQGNTTSATSIVTVVPSQADLTIAQPTISLTAGNAWDSTANITSIKTANGTDKVTPADALANKSLTIAVKDKDNNPVTIDASTKPGTYTVTYSYQPLPGVDSVTQTATLTIKPAPTTGGSGTNTGTTTPDNGEASTTQTTPVKPTKPGKTTKPTKTVHPVKPVTAKGAAIKDPPLKPIGEPQYTLGIQTGVTVNNAPLSSGEAAAALNHQNDRANPATVLSQAQADQLAANQAAARKVATRDASANNANQQDQQNRLADGTNATTLPQTSDQPATWTAQLGVLLLGLAGALGFRRKRN